MSETSVTKNSKPSQMPRTPSQQTSLSLDQTQRLEILEPGQVSQTAQALQELRRRAATKELQRRKLIHFTAAFTNDYMSGWVHQEVADHLEAFMEAVDRKLSPRLMIFLPPRTGK